jgi:hypothetical protein
MFVLRSRFLTRGEVWFDEEPDGRQVDWIYHHERSSPVPNCRWKEFYTWQIDLQKPPAELLAEMNKITARKITDAEENDRLCWERCDATNGTTLDEVERMWNEFAVAQKTPLFERDWIDQFSKAGRLDLSVAKDPAGNVLACHLVFLTPKRARQLIAISPYRPAPDVMWRGAVSRANCLIHWKNFLAYKEQGISCFDFGGWYTGTTNIQLLGINQFKKSFGGQVVREFDCQEIRTAKGWAMLTAARLLERAGVLKQNGEAPFDAPWKPEAARSPAQNPKISPALD